MREALKAFTTQFAPLSDEDFNRYADLFRLVNVRRLDHLFREGDNVNKLYYVNTGVLRGYYLKEGVEHTCNFFFSPYMMTDLFSVRDNVPTLMNVQAIKDSECYEVDFAEIEELAFQNPDLLKVFFKMYEHLFRLSIKRQISFIYDTPTERYVNLFKERPNVIAEIPQHYIASFLGIQPETLSRIRKRIF
ncbi:Crp/Fnr family transcriptional regulator [Flavobacterium sp. MFBS3-15]|uniref:Crp/Fnr family transcriptional regulator n=1 Tax=Flavobacterium sp. MFBS3-15 TaxID=2989816 RepID=UPI0022369B3C|nr:Crp/Fnr family transcriptional regulator [Flavobacterium sp. MFBS3-15]MCW4467706.1 Crp/Fnr family transcriptional regulator [Flavobacterium sp. MFBS3-15]